jgi:hypothetical protein
VVSTTIKLTHYMPPIGPLAFQLKFGRTSVMHQAGHTG